MAEKVTIARPYAKAVFALACEREKLAQWSEFLGIAAGNGEVASIAIAGASKLLNREVDKKTHADLLDKLVAEL